MIKDKNNLTLKKTNIFLVISVKEINPQLLIWFQTIHYVPTFSLLLEI